MSTMTITINMPYDPEAHRRRVAELLKECGGTEGYIGKVTLGTRTVTVPSPTPPAGVHAAGSEGSYMARKSTERWGRKPHQMPVEEAFLLGKIHHYHLQALAAMGKEAVRRHARGLVFAGYTYGLLPDPVSNIVANALWYDSMFPPSSREVEVVRMLSGKAIFRMACRSLDALIAYMMYYAPTLSTPEVWSCLASVAGDLQCAVGLLRERGIGLGDQQGAFKAAIQASDLPNEAVREAHLTFVTRHDYVRKLLLDHHFWISPSIVRSIGPLFPLVPCVPYMGAHAMRESAGTSTSSPSNLSPSAYRALRLKMNSFRMEEELSLAIVQLALQKLALQFGEPYELHMVCGKNFVIVSPESYYHINFLASREGGSNMPELFFAEVRGAHKDVNDVTLCCPLTENNGTCFACDCKGVKLIHPAEERFNDVEVTKRDCSLMPDPTLDFGAPLNEDYIFFELDKHPETATFLEANYSYMNDDQVDLSNLWFGNYLP